MAWDLPSVPDPGNMATVANWAQKVINSLQYLYDTPALSGQITKFMLKTGTTWSEIAMAALERVNVSMQDNTFFPNFYSDLSGEVGIEAYRATPTSGDIPAGRFTLYNEGLSSIVGFNYRYATSSGPPEIWIGLDKNDFIVAVHAGDDPPIANPPIEHPRITKWITLKPTKEEFETLKLECTSNVAQALISEGRIKGKHLLFREREWIVEPKPGIHL